MAVTINNQHGTYANVKDTFPQSTSVSGTITKAGANLIVGVGTAFTTEFQAGEWIYVAGITEIQQIEQITSDTELYLKQQFSGAVSGATYKRVPKFTYRAASWKIDSTGTANIDGQTIDASTSGALSYMNAKRPRPIIIDTTTNGNKVYIEILY